MRWLEFLEKSWQARPDQEVMVEAAGGQPIAVKGIAFDADNVIILTEDQND